MFDAMVESGGEYTPDWTSGVDGHGTVLAFSWLPWQHGEIKSRRDGPRTGNRHFILKKVKFYSRSRKKVTVLNLFYKGAVNAYFLTGSFFKKTVVFEAAIFVGQSEDGAEVRCEVSRRVETEVHRSMPQLTNHSYLTRNFCWALDAPAEQVGDFRRGSRRRRPGE